MFLRFTYVCHIYPIAPRSPASAAVLRPRKLYSRVEFIVHVCWRKRVNQLYRGIGRGIEYATYYDLHGKVLTDAADGGRVGSKVRTARSAHGNMVLFNEGGGERRGRRGNLP